MTDASFKHSNDLTVTNCSILNELHPMHASESVYELQLEKQINV
ncbi:hypothetical protein [Bacillus sp. PK3-130]